MPTLPENSARSPASVPLPVVLHSRHQWLRWRGMLIAGILGLTATLAALWILRGLWAAHLPWLVELWVGGILITLTVVGLASRLAPDSLLVTARILDGRFAAKGRLEAAAVFKDSTSPLAIAQREETALYLARETQARAVRVLPWLRAVLIALVLAHLLTLVLWIAPSLLPSARPVLAAKPPPPPPSAGVPQASITWQSPAPATQANPAEEVPAVATVSSTTGMQDLTLEVSVNGEVKKSIPLPEPATGTPGSHEIQVPLHLDDLKVQPFDVVSYYLHGRRISTESQPDTTSPVQFVQVRPFRDASPSPPASPSPGSAGAPPPADATQVLGQLELAELQSMQDNFALAHSELPPNDPARAQEDDRVGQEQAELSSRTEQIAQALAEEHLPANTLDPLRQAEPLMDDSGKKILATQNDAAEVSQQKALDLIIQGEKAAYQDAGTTPPPAGPNAANSFTDSQPHTLEPRQQTLVSELETLANNQTQLAQDMDKDSDDSSTTTSPDASTSPAATPAVTAPATSPATPGSSPNATSTPPPASPAVDPFGPDADQGTLAERQERVVQGIATLQGKAGILPQAGNDALAAAQKDGDASLHQLSAEQADAAREPAAAAALDLQQTVQALNQAGREETRQDLAQAQQQLNAAADQLRAMAQDHPADAAPRLMQLATEVHDVQANLESDADQQQDTGSAQGADQLNVLASKLQDQKIAPNLAAMSKSGLDPGRATAQADALENLASQAASGMTPAKPSPQDYAGLANSLEQTQATIAHLADEEGEGSADSPNADPPASGSGSQPGQQASADTPANGSGSQPSEQAAANSPANASGSQPGQQTAANTPANASGSQPGQQAAANSPANGSGSQPGQQAAANSPANASGSQPGEQTAANSPTNASGSQPGQQAAANTPANTSGSQPGEQAAAATPGSQPGQQPGQPSAAGPPGESSTPTPHDAEMAQAYHEALQDLKNQTQQLAKVVPSGDANAVDQVIARYDKDTSYRDVKGVDVVRFHSDLQQPLEKLIVDVQSLQQHAQRTEIVTTPDLDETPAAYRPAVSRYFEDVSRDYHPSAAPAPSTP